MVWYAKYFDTNKIMFFKASDKKLLKKSIKIWERISSLIIIELDSDFVYGDNDVYIETKI